VAAALPFLSFDLTHNEAYLALAHWYQDEPELWGLYGFRDGFNLDSAAGWYAHDYLGLDQGMALVAIENRRSGLIWRMLRQDPGINAAQSAVLAPTCSSYLPLIWRP
jgi:hypothetical protein